VLCCLCKPWEEESEANECEFTWPAKPATGLFDAEFNATGAELTKDAWARHWQVCVDEAAASDVLLFYAGGADERQMGALIEVGVALGSSKPVYAVAPDLSILHHPKVRRFTSLEKAIAALMAQLSGERARARPPMS
jgi:hypothetical protein